MIFTDVEEHNNEVTLILLGDIFDLTAGWEADYMPCDNDGKITDEDLLYLILNEIISHNPETINELRKFLQVSDKSRIVLTNGNHDNVIILDGFLRKLIASALLPEACEDEQNERILFAKSVEAPDLRLFGNHGNKSDHFNYSEQNASTIGDWLTIKINILRKNVIGKTRQSSLPSDAKEKIIDDLKRLADIRPVLTPTYLQILAKHYYELYKKLDLVLAKKIYELITSFSEDVGKVLIDFPLIEKITKRLPILRHLASSRRFQAIVGKVGALFEERKADNNASQIKAASALARTKRYDFFVYGHTHNVEHKRDQFHFVNVGTWKPEIRRIKNGNGLPTPILQKGALRLSTDLSQNRRRREIRYSTLQSNEVK